MCHSEQWQAEFSAELQVASRLPPTSCLEFLSAGRMQWYNRPQAEADVCCKTEKAIIQSFADINTIPALNTTGGRQKHPKDINHQASWRASRLHAPNSVSLGEMSA